jgi:biopolymer transport protein ExbB
MDTVAQWIAGRPAAFFLLYEEGGWVMPFLVVEAALLWFALGYRVLALRRGSRRSVRTLLERHSRSHETSKVEPRGVIVTAMARGLEIARRGTSDLRSHLDAAFAEQEREVVRFAVMVNAIVIIAPLTGLLGTVSGMIETFDSLAEMALFSQSGGIAGGISEALFTTQMGLAVAIPGHLVGQTLSRKQAVLETELEQLKDLLCARQGEVAS